MKRILVISLVILLVVLGMAGCAKTDAAGTLKMGTNAAFAPFESKEGGKYVGIDIEIATKIAEKMGKELEVVDMEFDSLPSAVNSSKCDFVAAAMTVRPDREEQMDFSNKYYTATQMVIVKADSTVATQDDLKNLRLGCQAGTTGEEAATAVEGAQVSAYKNGIEASMALLNGQIDAIIIDSEPSKALQKQNPNDLKVIDMGYDPEYYAIAVKKGNTELVNTINQVLQEMTDDGSLDEIIARHTAQ